MIGGFVVRDPGLPTLARPLPVRRPVEAARCSRRRSAATPPRASRARCRSARRRRSARTPAGTSTWRRATARCRGSTTSRVRRAPCGPGGRATRRARRAGWRRRAAAAGCGSACRAIQPAGRVQAAAPRAPRVHGDAPGARLPRRAASRSAAGRARVVRITPTRKRLRRLERRDRGQAPDADPRPHPRRGRRPRRCSGSGRGVR